MSLGWPSFDTQHSVLQYVGPLPATCACSTIHPSLRGEASNPSCPVPRSTVLGPHPQQYPSLPASLFRAVPLVLISSGGYSGYGFALSAAPESVSALYEAWKSNTLTRSLFRDFSASRLDSFFESRGLARNTVFLFSLLSPACKFLESRRAARAVPGFLGMSSRVVPSVPLCSPVSPHIGLATHPGSSSIFSGGSPVSSGAAALDGERSFEHFLSLTIERVPRTGQDCTTSNEFPQSDESERLSDFPARSRSKRKGPLESDGRVWEQFGALDASGELASIRGIGLLSTSSRSPQTLQSLPVRSRPGGLDGNGRRSSPAASAVSGASSAQDR